MMHAKDRQRQGQYVKEILLRGNESQHTVHTTADAGKMQLLRCVAPATVQLAVVHSNVSAGQKEAGLAAACCKRLQNQTLLTRRMKTNAARKPWPARTAMPTRLPSAQQPVRCRATQSTRRTGATETKSLRRRPNTQKPGQGSGTPHHPT